MKSSLNVLDRKAVNAALNQQWDEAVEVNTLIISLNPIDLNAKIRLGKAYLHLGEFTKAKKIFKEILTIDPLNQIAKKNYEYAKIGKPIKDNQSKSQIIIREPGLTSEVPFTITEPKITANGFNKGDVLEIKVLKKSIQVFYVLKDKKVYLGDLEPVLTQKLIAASLNGAELSALFISGEGKNTKILLRSSNPIFKGQKQEVKPYVKQSSYDAEEDDEDDEEKNEMPKDGADE